MKCVSRVGLLAAVMACSMSGKVIAAEFPQAQREALKVCADPFSLPSSNKESQGYENRIAELFAKDLGLPLQYEWFPQRIGFIRKTLKDNDTPDGSYKCDLVMGASENFELAATTKTYYRSAWTMVYVKGRGFDDVKSQDDLLALPPDRKQRLRIGLFDQSPAALWVAKHGLLEVSTPYQSMTGDARRYPGEIIEKDLVEDKINLTFVWGPIAGYFAKQIKTPEIVVIPMRSEPGIKFDFGIAMAVRFGEKAWRERVNEFIEQRSGDIRSILVDYGVPLMDVK